MARRICGRACAADCARENNSIQELASQLPIQSSVNRPLPPPLITTSSHVCCIPPPPHVPTESLYYISREANQSEDKAEIRLMPPSFYTGTSNCALAAVEIELPQASRGKLAFYANDVLTREECECMIAGDGCGGAGDAVVADDSAAAAAAAAADAADAAAAASSCVLSHLILLPQKPNVAATAKP